MWLPGISQQCHPVSSGTWPSFHHPLPPGTQQEGHTHMKEFPILLLTAAQRDPLWLCLEAAASCTSLLSRSTCRSARGLLILEDDLEWRAPQELCECPLEEGIPPPCGSGLLPTFFPSGWRMAAAVFPTVFLSLVCEQGRGAKVLLGKERLEGFASVPVR